jgi:FkbM family methyltransferase
MNLNLKRLSRIVERITEYPSLLISRFKGISFNHTDTCLTAKDLIGNVKTVIDIGANEGLFIKSAKYVFPKAKVYAFEPQIKFYNVIKNINGVTAFNFGLWDREEESTFYVNKENTGASSFLKPMENYTKYIGSKDKISEVRLQKKRFDKLKIPIIRPCFVKIDVEGAEMLVLRGMKRILSSQSPPVLMLEAFPTWMKDFGFTTDDIFSLLTQNGYVMYFISKNELVICQSSEEMEKMVIFPEFVDFLCVVPRFHKEVIRSLKRLMQ